MDSPSERHVVQIFDRNQQHLETTVIAIPNYRLQPTGKTEFSFWETPAGVPKAVRAWFYPGDNYGQEFPYPKKLVAQLASAAPVPVPMNYNEPAPAAQPEPQPEPAPAANPAPAPAPEPQPQPQQAAPAPAPVTPAPAALPHTASFNSLFGLLGVASLSLAGLLTLADRPTSVKVKRS
jgi:outer membrane biosynthesis protein TonB